MKCEKRITFGRTRTKVIVGFHVPPHVARTRHNPTALGVCSVVTGRVGLHAGGVAHGVL